MTLKLEPERRIFRVSELNAEVQRLFETDFRSIWVTGEISGCRVAASGHYYFTLKDEESQLKCALFKGAARFAKFKPEDGLAVIARGNLEVYEARGEYQLIVELLQPQGAGALQLAFEQLKRKLAAEGLFETSRKRPLPRLPRRIGIVSSPAGAVIRDMLNILERRFPGLHIRLFPAQVQGEGSAEQVCQGIRYFSGSGWAEVVIVARGGGSLEDLWTFNEERVARMIAGSAIPIISAIGHETDFTIADFVADCRAPTPSAAAEIIVCTRESLLEQIAGCRTKSLQAMRYRLLICARDLQQRGTERSATLMHRSLRRRAQQVDDLEYRLRDLQKRSTDARGRRFADLHRRLQASNLRLRFARNHHQQELLRQLLLKGIGEALWRLRRRQESLEGHLRQLSPLTVLGRGYAIVENSQHHILRSSAETSAGEELKIRLHRGELDVVVSAAREKIKAVSGIPAICLLSGGLDSSTCLAIAREQGFDCYCLSFDYGQRHRVELFAASRVAESLGAKEHRTLQIDLRVFGESALTADLDVPKGRSDHEMSREIPVTYVPARNTIFLSFALAYAEVKKASDIFIGVNAIDYSGYPDCRPEFIQAFEKMANLATKAAVEGKTKVKIHAPLMRMSKTEILRKAIELGVDLGLTHSCYDPDDSGRPCGTCDSCALRRKAFEEAGVADPVLA